MQAADIHLLDKKLGVPSAGDCFLDISDSVYHQKLEGFSSSALKEYFHDPEHAFSHRVRGLADKEPHGPTTLKAFRVGRAIHCAILEGDAPFKQRFPIFGGAKKTGKIWEDMKTAHPDALAEDNILTKAEAAEVMDITSTVKPQFDALFTNRNIVALYPEASFVMVYGSGIQLKVRCDLLYIEEINGILYFRILDLKTCSFAPTNGFQVSMTASRLCYDLSAVMYYKVVRDCLSIPSVLQKLGLQTNVNPLGTFEILWVGKESKTTGLQYLMPNQHPESEVSWESLGVAKLLAAISGYQQMALRLQQECAHFNNDYGTIQTRRTMAMNTPPLSKEKWALKDLAGYVADETPFSQLMPSEGEIARQSESLFGKPLKVVREKKKEEKTPPPPLPKQQDEKPKWSFNTQTAPINTQLAPGTPPPIHTEKGVLEGALPPENLWTLPKEILDKYKRKQDFKKYMKDHWGDQHDKIDWKGTLKIIKAKIIGGIEL